MREILLTGAALWLATRKANAGGEEKGNLPKLKKTEFPDGTGTIGLPAGWKIDGSYRGSCGCKGPGKSAVIMGFPWNIVLPDSAYANFPNDKPLALARLGDLPTALRETLKVNGGQLLNLRSRPAPAAIPGVPATNFIYDYKSEGTVFTGMGFFTTIDGGPGAMSWQLYSSAVTAPKARFVQELPTLTAIYLSWNPNGKKPKPGSEGGRVDALFEASRKMVQDSMKAQQERYDQIYGDFKKVN